MSESLYALMESRIPGDRSRVLLETGDGGSYSYAQAETAAIRMARALADRGVAKGDRVAVQVDKSPEALFLYLACLRAGFVFLPMNTAYRPDEVDYLVGNAEPSVIVCRPADVAIMEGIAAKHDGPLVLTLDTDGTGTLAEAAEEAPADFPMVECAADDLAAMLYTSGTTGKPKGAMLTHGNLAANGLDLVESWRFTADDVLLHALPIFHAHGLFVACHCVLLAGASMIWLPGFDRAEVLRHLPRATAFMGVPTFYVRLLAGEDFNREACAAMRLFTAGSAPLLAETHEAFSARTGHAILERYGMTETGMLTGNPYDGERRPGSVGFPFPQVEVRVADEQDQPVVTDAIGDIQVRGPNVMKGYWRLPEKTAEDFTADGWFRTGDVGRIDERGYLFIVGRAKDLVITGGYNVYPKEVESVIDDLPGVVESAVIGVRHPDFGEGVLAVVVPAAEDAPDEAAIMAHCKEHLANYKTPKRVFFVEELPRNTMGKVQKAQLREQHADLFKG
ncbi:malonyl-CoA synthase [Roseospira marina]|uniref:3-methylmercaptopropionyl-CoA ligase n=1 Tax=Roseospira marina TaxID=140057 RepID=A0A5M6IC60_9PROT|nr:malonyl-CoA synthase [Roseospira marina]KAA5605870.1 malonyl-CoA synthase [Roseospira marina]MBB4313690.1 malonyl-CoA/methylmalonyl-CoA synthetase [Roseospira marina]MBB5086852.1 malonyl-CoA/methylmalonyl-CoA synthetase [Roseospira marina]